MVKVNVLDKGKIYNYYMDGKLQKQLDGSIKSALHVKDKDWVLIIDGMEGCGKSVFAMQVAKYVDSSFNIDRIAFNGQQFKEIIMKAGKGQAVVFDEAFVGLSSRAALSEINNMLVGLMMQMRQKNLFVIIVLPSFFLLDKYVALWRAKGLFHVYEKDGKRGQWIYLNKNKKKLIYIKGKKTYSYYGIRSGFRGRFIDYYTVDEQEYRKRKGEALESRQKEVKQSKYIYQRDILVLMLRREAGFHQKAIAEWMTQWKVPFTREGIRDIEAKYRDSVGIKA